jgi:hypothetical protein
MTTPIYSYNTVFNQAVVQLLYSMLCFGFIIGDYLTIERNKYYIHDMISIGIWRTTIYEYLLENIVFYNFALLFACFISTASKSCNIKEETTHIYSWTLRSITWIIYQSVFLWNIYGICIILSSSAISCYDYTQRYIILSLIVKIYLSYSIIFPRHKYTCTWESNSSPYEN